MRQSLFAAITSLLVSACAGTVSPVRLSPQNPADSSSPEAVTPPLAPGLMGEGVVEGAPRLLYTCPTHSAVQGDHPALCSVCGAALVKKEGTKP